MRYRQRWVIAGVAAAAVTLAASEAPLALRRFDGFRVGRVHVTGTKHLSSADAIAASGITATSSVFDDLEPWREALERDPLVRRARVSRRLPDTIVLEIIESEPIALVRQGTEVASAGAADQDAARRIESTSLPPAPRSGDRLHAVDARGLVLPIEASRFERELPEVKAEITIDEAGPRIDTSGVRLVQAFARIREAEPWLAAWTSEIVALPDGVRLTVNWPAGAEVLLSTTDADALEAIRLTVLDLASRVKADSGDISRGVGTPLERLDRVDARFRDQVVVTLREAGDASREETAR